MNHRGFTILEILITITIMSLFMGGAFVGFSDFSKKQKLTAAGENLKNILRDVQSRVSSGEMDCSVCDCSSAGGVSEGWWVDFTAKEYYGKCKNVAGEIVSHSHKPIELSPDIVIAPQIAAPMHFRLPPAGVDNAGRICLSNPELSGLYYRLNIESSGNITDTGELDSSCTP